MIGAQIHMGCSSKGLGICVDMGCSSCVDLLRFFLEASSSQSFEIESNRTKKGNEKFKKYHEPEDFLMLASEERTRV